MSLRIFSAGCILALTGCGGPPDSVAPGNTVFVSSGDTGTPAGEPVERVACAIGNAPLAEVCTVDRTRDGERTLLTIRHPDGGFRRLHLSDGGRITAADGAVPAAVAIGEGVAEVSLGDARYRLPIGRQ